MENKFFKYGIACILFGIACILKMMVFNESNVTELMGNWMPWIGILLIGIGFYKDL